MRFWNTPAKGVGAVMYAGVQITSSPPFPPQLGQLWGFSFVIFSHAQSRGNILGSTQRSTQWQNGTPLGGSTHFKNGAPLRHP